MKIFAVIGAILLVAFQQINAKPPIPTEAGSFSKDVANLTSVMLSSVENPNNMDTLVYKISAFIQVSQEYHLNFGVYDSIFNTLYRLAYDGSALTTPEKMLLVIREKQNKFDRHFDELNVQRDVDASELPSEINKLIDEFIKRYSDNLIELFDNMYVQTKHLQDESEKIAANSITLMDSLVEKVEKCIEIPLEEFKNIFECHEDTRTLLPSLAHDTAMVEVITKETHQMPQIKMDGKVSVNDLEWQIVQEKRNLMEQIQNLRDKREASKENSEEA